jgi:hypothetical protein
MKTAMTITPGMAPRTSAIGCTEESFGVQRATSSGRVVAACSRRVSTSSVIATAELDPPRALLVT